MSDVTFGTPALAPPQDQFNRRAEKALADVDVPQRLTASYTYELPLGKGKPWLSHGVAAGVAGGWSVAAIHTFEAGGTLRISTPNNLPLFGGYLRPNRVAG